MKKILLMAAAAAAMFSSCVGNDNGAEELEPIIPGLQLYDYASVQNHIALQPVDMAMRLAVLEAEADKQEASTGTRPELESVRVGATQLYESFFGENNGTRIEKLGGGDYRITFDPRTITDYYMCRGTMTVKTGGQPLSRSEMTAPWTVEFDPGFQVLLATSSGAGYQAVDLSAGSYSIYRSLSLYRVEMQGAVASQSGKTIRSSWNGSFSLTPPQGGEALAWSDFAGKNFTVDGSASGDTLFSLDNATPLSMVYQVEAGLYLGSLQILGGKETCRLVNGALYTETFPSPVVTISWQLYGNYTLRQTVVYNGYTVTR